MKVLGKIKRLKSNSIVLKIVEQYDRNLKCFEIGGKRIQTTIEDVALSFGLPIEGDDFIMNKTCTLKDRGFAKHYFKNLKNITKISIENTLNDLFVEKRRRSELDVTKWEQHMKLNEVIKDIQRLAA